MDRQLPEDVVAVLRGKVAEVNSRGRLHIQLVLNEPKAFKGIFAYGKFSGVQNYFVVAGSRADDLDERAGYYGEQLVLLAQTLGLNTCWAGLSYTKVAGTYTLEAGEKIACYIALGYGVTQGCRRKSKGVEDVSNAGSSTPQWFRDGVAAALLAPTAINQQKFHFEYLGGNKVRAGRVFSFVGYTQMDLGIAKLHFEIGAGRSVEWV